MQQIFRQFFFIAYCTSATIFSSLAQTTDSPRDSIPASFAGGEYAWRLFLMKNQKIPDFFIKMGVNAKVACRVQFIIDTSGKFSDVKITKSGCCGTDEEAIRIITASEGHWSPATLHGKPLSSTITQPFVFQVDMSDGNPIRSLEELRELYNKWSKKRPKS